MAKQAAAATEVGSKKVKLGWKAMFEQVCFLLEAGGDMFSVFIEGVMGAGKTQLVEAIGKKKGMAVVRLLLTQESDAGEIFGMNIPAEEVIGGVKTTVVKRVPPD